MPTGRQWTGWTDETERIEQVYDTLFKWVQNSPFHGLCHVRFCVYFWAVQVMERVAETMAGSLAGV